MTSGIVLARNAFVNFAAQVIPLAVAIVAIPVLIGALGTSRYGILTLVWVTIGYFGLFDLGIGRALTHAVAVRIGNGTTEELGRIIWTALALMGVLGLIGGLVLAASTPLLIDHVLNVPADAAHEARIAFYVMAAAIPAALVTAGLRGVLEAFQDFPTGAALRIPLAMLNYLAPLAVLPIAHSLVLVVAALSVVRWVGCILHGIVCVWRYPFLRGDVKVEPRLVTPLLRYGGWLTVTNTVSPLMANLDRFMIGAILPMTAVALYVTPFEIVGKLFVIPGAVLGVLFPAFASTFAGDRARTAMLVDRGMRAILLCIFPATLVLVCLAHEGLALWINREFADGGARVLQWLAAGVLINSAGQVAFTALQGVGRPDLTAKINLIELPFYLAGIWLLAQRFGLTGVAMAWTLRVSADTIAVFLFTAREIPTARAAIRSGARLLTCFTICLVIGANLPTLAWRIGALVVGGIAFVTAGWFLLLEPSERDLARRAGRALVAVRSSSAELSQPD